MRTITAGINKIALPCFRRGIIYGFTMRAGSFSITLDAVMLPLAPVTAWMVARAYVPIIGTGLNDFQAWTISIISLVIMFLSLLLHSFAHVIADRSAGRAKRIFLSPLGDPAHLHPAAAKAGREALAAFAGPLAQGLLAGVFYILWDLQINLFISTIASYAMFFNLGLAALNLIPVFPFDGGRLVRAVSWGLTGRPGQATRLAQRAGWVLVCGLAGWGIVLIIQQARYSLETAAAVFVFCILTAISLIIYERWRWDRPEPESRAGLIIKAVRGFLAALLVLPLAAVAFSLVPLNEGLKAPGFTASVEPMIQLPPEYRYSSSGSLMLVTVIPQAPILAGEWLYARFDRSISIEPQEKIIPRDKTAQEVSTENHLKLRDSETAAIIAGLRLAGYPVEISGDNTAVLPFPVEIVPQKVNGGPSAGLMFTLGVYNLLTESDLTGGKRIAGTGTIDPDGNVGPIGGVKQKVVAAERAGAEYFFSPAENYGDALAMAGNIKVIKVTTAREAIDFLISLSHQGA